MSKISNRVGASAGAVVMTNVLYSIWIMIDVVTGRELDLSDAMSLGGTLMFAFILVANSVVKGLADEED